MTEEKDNELQKILKETFKKVRDKALVDGVRVACMVVLEKAKNEKLSEHDRLEDIIAYCNRAVAVKKDV